MAQYRTCSKCGKVFMADTFKRDKDSLMCTRCRTAPPASTEGEIDG